MTTLDATRRARSAYRSLWIILALLIPATLLAFAPFYFKGTTFSRLTLTPLIHVHAALMLLWLLMLVMQAKLIQAKRYRLHRWVGRSSFVIVPLIIAMTMLMIHEKLNRATEIPTLVARFQIYNLMEVTGFGLAWALGILCRHRTATHVRFMVSTVLAMGSPIVFRIILHWFAWMPGLGREHIESVAAANGVVLLIVLLALIAMDWRLGIRRSPFWVVTLTTLVIHVGFFTFTKSGWWMSAVQWYAALPSP